MFATGLWGKEAKLRSKKRLDYFKRYHRLKLQHKLFRSSHGVGLRGEKIALKILKGSVWHGKVYDIDWNNERIDVKTSMLHLCFNKYWRWDFDYSFQKEKVDAIFCIGLDLQKRVVKTWLIPPRELENKRHISIAENSNRLDNYLIGH